MTREEYALELDIYKKEQEALYYDALNRFNANEKASMLGRRFIKYNSHYIDMDSDGTSASMLAILNLVNNKKGELVGDFNNKNIRDCYEIIGGYEEAVIDECHFIVTWETIKPIESVDFSRGENILRRALEAVVNRPIYTISPTLVRDFVAGTRTWAEIVTQYER